MSRVAVCLLLASAVAAAPVPEESKAVKDRKALLAEVGVIETKEKLPALTAPYEPDEVTAETVRKSPEKHPFRAACVKAAAALRECRATPQLTDFPQVPAKGKIAAGIDKAALKRQQEATARRIVELEEALDELTANAGKFDAERSKRWKANYEFLLASVRQERVAADEYNMVIARVLTELTDLPPLTDTDTGWRMVPAAKLHGRKVTKEMAQRATEGFHSVSDRYPDTPWAVLADAAHDRPLGYEWSAVKLPTGKKK